MIWLVVVVLYGLTILGVYFYTKYKFHNKLPTSEVNDLLSEILRISFKNNSLSGAAQGVIDVLRRFYGMDSVTILLYNERTGNLSTIASNVNKSYLPYIERYCNEVFHSLGKSVSRVHSCEDNPLGYLTASERDIHFSNFTTLKHKGKTIGGILLEHTDPKHLLNTEDRMNLYEKVLNSTTLVLQHVLYTENLISMTSTDQLTGVYNRRFIDMNLEEQLSIHQSLGMSMTVAIFDIDHFKKFNDTYGHPFGDIVLQEVAKYMQSHMTGEHEWVARYGGEEFVLFFGRSNINDIAPRVDRIRHGLSQLVMTDGETQASVTASFGLATYPYFNESVSGLIAKADEALYQSKNTGRNRVTVARKKR